MTLNTHSPNPASRSLRSASPARVSIAERSARGFPKHAFLSGYSLYAGGRVTVGATTRTAVDAVVRSSRARHVQIRAHGDGIAIGCGCIATSLEGDAVGCKHAWAALLEIDRLELLEGMRASTAPLVVSRLSIEGDPCAAALADGEIQPSITGADEANVSTERARPLKAKADRAKAAKQGATDATDATSADAPDTASASKTPPAHVGEPRALPEAAASASAKRAGAPGPSATKSRKVPIAGKAPSAPKRAPDMGRANAKAEAADAQRGARRKAARADRREPARARGAVAKAARARRR